MRQTIADLARMARREAFLGLLGLTPPIKRRLTACVQGGIVPPIVIAFNHLRKDRKP